MSRPVAVEVETADRIVLRGEAHVRSSDWAILAHDLGEDIDHWRPLPRRLARDGMSVLALDLRGHGGSDGEADARLLDADMATGIAYARSRGASRLYLVAAGRVCTSAAAASSGSAGLVCLAPVGSSADWGRVPRLAVVGSTNPEQQLVAEGFRRGPGRAIVAHVPFHSPGLGVLRSSWSTNVIEHVAGFLKGQRLVRPPRVAR